MKLVTAHLITFTQLFTWFIGYCVPNMGKFNLIPALSLIKILTKHCQVDTVDCTSYLLLLTIHPLPFRPHVAGNNKRRRGWLSWLTSIWVSRWCQKLIFICPLGSIKHMKKHTVMSNLSCRSWLYIWVDSFARLILVYSITFNNHTQIWFLMWCDGYLIVNQALNITFYEWFGFDCKNDKRYPLSSKKF